MTQGWSDALEELGAASDEDTGWSGALGELLQEEGGTDPGGFTNDWLDMLGELQARFCLFDL